MSEEKNICHYDIEADWVLNDFCNYSCDYCFFHAKKEKWIGKHPSARDYLQFFNETGKTWLFHFTGGEPLFYPNFTKLCRELATSHFLALNSNLSTPEILNFAKQINPSRVEYIHCGIHPKQRELHEGYEKLLEKITTLLVAGFPLFASVVMTPDIFEKFEMLLKQFTSIDVPLLPKVIRGNYMGRPYPESYTTKERSRIREFAQRAEEVSNNSRWSPFRNDPTINPKWDKHFLNGFPDFRGESCSAGMDFVRIKPDGTIYRCGKKSMLGNLFQQRIELFKHARLCDDTACPYICLRYTHISLQRSQSLPKRVKIDISD